MGVGGPEHGLQLDPAVDISHPAQNRGGQLGETERHRESGAGEHAVVDPVGQQVHAVVAGGEALDQSRRGGKHHVGVAGQIALLIHIGLVPLPVAVVHQAAVCQLVQMNGLFWTGAPQHRLPKMVVNQDLFHKVGAALLISPLHGRVIPSGEHGGGKGIHGNVGAHLAALLGARHPTGDGRLKKENLDVVHPGQQLLGAVGASLPWGVGQAENLLHDTHLKRSHGNLLASLDKIQ